MKILSIVVPCYNEEKALPYFYDEINKISKDMGRKYRLEFEFVFVDDGSKDNTANILKNMADTFFLLMEEELLTAEPVRLYFRRCFR